MKKITLTILVLLFSLPAIWAQKNSIKDFNFQENSFVLNAGDSNESGIWYAELKGNSKGVFELAEDPFFEYKVFHADMSVVKDREEAYLSQNIKGLEKRVYKVGFWAKLMHRNAILRVEMQGFGTGAESAVKNKTILASTEVNKSLTSFVPANWIYYSFDMDLTNVDDSMLEDGKFIRFACYFNTYDNAGTSVYQNPSGDRWDFYISGVDVKRSRSSYVLDGNFNAWTSSWPVASQAWNYTTDGDVCFERARGHRMDDFSIKADVRNAGAATQIKSKVPVNFPTGEFDIHFWARADQDSKEMKVSVQELGISDKSFTLSKKWKMYSIRINNAEKVKSGSIDFNYSSVGTFYLDEVSIEDITEQRDEDGYNAYTVTSALDDAEVEGTLRYYVNIASAGDSVFIDKSISSIKLLSTLDITKSLVLCGQGATIQVPDPGVSAYRLFTFGDNSNLGQVIKICDLNLLGGNITNYGAVGIIYKNTIFHADRVTFAEGKAQYSGGLHTDNALGSEVYLTDCIFRNNESTKNGGAFYAKGKAVLQSCLFEDNKIISSGDGNGSAIATNADVQIIDCIFRGNVAEGTGAYGAALFNTANAVALVDRCLFENNSSTNATKGTGVFACSGNDTKTIFTNCTFSNNKGFQGSTIYNRAGYVYLINSTIAGNLATSARGAIDVYNVNTAKVYLVNSILAYNYGTSTMDISLGANSVLIGDYNLISSVNGGATSLTNAISFTYTEPLFSDLEEIIHNGQTLNVPTLFEYQVTKVIKTSVASVANDAGRVGVFEGYAIPTIDQCGLTRGVKPTLGAREYPVLTSIENTEAGVTYILRGNELILDLQKQSLINLIDVSGRVILSSRLEEGETSINIESLKKGVYIIQVIGENLTAKFIR